MFFFEKKYFAHWPAENLYVVFCAPQCVTVIFRFVTEKTDFTTCRPPTARKLVRQVCKICAPLKGNFLEFFRAPKQAFFQHLCAIIRKKFRAPKQNFSGRLSKQFVRHSAEYFVRHYTEKVQGA
jgi:hypothetical protein